MTPLILLSFLATTLALGRIQFPHSSYGVYQASPKSDVEVAFQWYFLDWIHPSIQLAGKNFTIGNPLTQDVDIDRRGRVFVTTPQWLKGTPITLSIVTNLQGPGGPLLSPYPDWSWHKSDCDSLVSVYRIAIDECDRMWMVDTGTVSGQSVCPSKIVVFDLGKDKLLFKYVIPLDQTAGRRASYVCPIVEVGDTCDDAFLYVADVLAHGLLIYNLRTNRSWRLDNTPSNAFGNDIEATNLTIVGENIDLTDGILGMSLSPRGFFANRYLYFNALASFFEKFVDANSLKRSFIYEPIIYQSTRRRVSHAGAQATSKTGAIFFQLGEFTALACWNIERSFSPENIVELVQDEETLQYISGIKVIVNALGEEELWFNTNRLQKTVNKSRRINEVNFRLIRAKVDNLIRGTKCEATGYRETQPNLLGWKRI
ncbi:PREDICTED: major royal jelly protein 1-like [Ceratosolen solmsi marchali]|uniref:Major royal jelly protein 1-like n=1 Tax=Ceratosolen solmsi marchali TaxID=326594 RepID=A0AAJ7DV13_9HYME|nr:PREDICTED: major royal jelly protein 1-like [Ceratosolen solmsi marchali]XP_011497453.1 PREDICTED: major royal jelly protein 1-like [Ceratosolen solmsi marchali]